MTDAPARHREAELGDGPPATHTSIGGGAAGPRRVGVEVEVRYAETDAQGVVHHAVYPVWFEVARTRLCRESGRHYAEIERSGYHLTVTSVRVRYLRPARYGDTVCVSSWIERLGSRGVRFAYEVVRDGALLASGSTEHVWIDDAGRVRRIPDELRPAFERLAGGEG